MYLEYFGLNEPPFTITPHTEFFFAGANRGATLEALIYAITHGEGIVKVSGEVGSGKTMLCRVLMERLPTSVETIYLAIPSLNRDEMLGAICGDLGIVTESGAPNVQLKALQEHLLRLHGEGKRVVALIDEAHAMPLDSLEEIRLLSNLETNKSKLLQIVLFGQPELDEHLAKPQMRQLRERITHSFRLSPLTLEDVLEYLRHRLRAAGYKGAEVFNSACVKLIAKTSEGLTRRINIIADKSLLAAYSSNTHSVSLQHVKAAIRDSEFANASRPSQSHWLVGGALAAGLFIGALGAGWMMARSAPVSVEKSRVEETVASGASPAMPQTSPSPLRGEGRGESEMHKITPAATLSPTPLPSRERGFASETPVGVQSPTASPPSSLPDHLTASESWLGQEAPSHWVIQLTLANANETNHLLNFIRDTEQTLGADRIHAYPLIVNDVPKVSVIYGSFPSRTDAQKAITALPLKVRQYKPYLRSIQMIRLEAKHAKKPTVSGSSG
jgi:MSHA biogenesis protein MshM